MNKATRKRQQRGQQQVRQLSIAATFMTTLMILVFHDYKTPIFTSFQLLINFIGQSISNHWLSIIVVGLISASLGYRLGRRQIQRQTIQVDIEPIHSGVFSRFSEQKHQANNRVKSQEEKENVVAFLIFQFSIFLFPPLPIVKLSKCLKKPKNKFDY